MESPQIEGVWAYPQAVPGGIAASRQVNGRWYDLFVLHQVAFPLTPGRFGVSAAKLTYNLPLAYQFFSQEERYTLQSETTSFAARALPAEGRQPDFAGAVGHGLSITRRLTPPAGRQGELVGCRLARAIDAGQPFRESDCGSQLQTRRHRDVA